MNDLSPPPDGFLEVGSTEDGQHVILNHPAIDVDENGCGHILFSPEQARALAALLLECADDCDLARLPRC